MSSLSNLIFNTKTHNAVSMASSIAGVSTYIPESILCGVQCTVTGSPVGTITIEGSNDGVNFGTILTHATTVATTFIDSFQPGYCYIQVRYTSTSGTGTLTVLISAKG